MRRYGGAAALAAAAIVIAGCTGGSADRTSIPTTTSSRAAVAAELSPDVRADLTGRLPSRTEWPGATSVGAAQVFAPAEAAAMDPDPVGEGKRLAAEGFVAAATTHVKAPGAQDAVASVFRFAGEPGAADMAGRMAATKGTTPFVVHGIPGAAGWHVVNGAGTVLAANITFTVGRYVYTVGGAPLATHPLTEAQLEAAARAWYARIAAL